MLKWIDALLKWIGPGNMHFGSKNLKHRFETDLLKLLSTLSLLRKQWHKHDILRMVYIEKKIYHVRCVVRNVFVDHFILTCELEVVGLTMWGDVSLKQNSFEIRFSMLTLSNQFISIRNTHSITQGNDEAMQELPHHKS